MNNILKLYELVHAADELLKEKLEALLPAGTKVMCTSINGPDKQFTGIVMNYNVAGWLIIDRPDLINVYQSVFFKDIVKVKHKNEVEFKSISFK